MVVERTEPPDQEVFSKEEGGGTCLASSLAAAVEASLHEGREAKTAGGAEEKEGLVPRLDTDKQCGGILLKNFLEGKCDKKMEKQEALLTVIAACNLTAQEQERLEEAEVAVTAKQKGTIDLKIKMGHADALMRKICSQLEKPCKEEGVRRYQIA